MTLRHLKRQVTKFQKTLSEEGIRKGFSQTHGQHSHNLLALPGCPLCVGLGYHTVLGQRIGAEQLQIPPPPRPRDNPYLEVVQRLHFHDWSQGVEGQRDINTLVWHQRGVNGQRSAWDDPKAGQEKNRDDDSSTALMGEKCQRCRGAVPTPIPFLP